MILSGATGDFRHQINGLYVPTAQQLNGKPVYAKEGDTNRWLFFSATMRWVVADERSLETNTTTCFADTEPGLAHPGAAKHWQSNEDVEWKKYRLDITVMVIAVLLNPNPSPNDGFFSSQDALEYLNLALKFGDIYCLGRALEASEGEAIEEEREAATEELARLEERLDDLLKAINDAVAAITNTELIKIAAALDDFVDEIAEAKGRWVETTKAVRQAGGDDGARVRAAEARDDARRDWLSAVASASTLTGPASSNNEILLGISGSMRWASERLDRYKDTWPQRRVCVGALATVRDAVDMVEVAFTETGCWQMIGGISPVECEVALKRSIRFWECAPLIKLPFRQLFDAADALESAAEASNEQMTKICSFESEAKAVKDVLKALLDGKPDPEPYVTSNKALKLARIQRIRKKAALDEAREMDPKDVAAQEAELAEARLAEHKCQRAVEEIRLEMLQLADQHFPEMFFDPVFKEALAGLDPTLAALDRPGRTLDVYAPLDWTDANRPTGSRHPVYLRSFDGVAVVLKEFDLGGSGAAAATQYRELTRQVRAAALILHCGLTPVVEGGGFTDYLTIYKYLNSIIQPKQHTPNTHRQARTQVKALARIDHPNVVKPRALFFSADRRKAYLETVLYERGTLDKHLRAKRLPRLRDHPKVSRIACRSSAR